MAILLESYAPQLVYVYGSMASGNISEWSDIDLVIVKETDKRFLDRTAEVLELLSPRIGMDIVVYTPGEWSVLLQKQHFVREEIAQKGKLLYAA